jgi:hypothetical protein
LDWRCNDHDGLFQLESKSPVMIVVTMRECI